MQDKATKAPKLNCRNWECGVIVPVAATDTETTGDLSNNDSLHVFDDAVPVPMLYPGAQYSGKIPWFFRD